MEHRRSERSPTVVQSPMWAPSSRCLKRARSTSSRVGSEQPVSKQLCSAYSLLSPPSHVSTPAQRRTSCDSNPSLAGDTTLCASPVHRCLTATPPPSDETAADPIVNAPASPNSTRATLPSVRFPCRRHTLLPECCKHCTVADPPLTDVWFDAFQIHEISLEDYNPIFDDEDGELRVEIGDYLTPRFQVRSLCGKGTYGTVWACHDAVDKRLVAVKVARATPTSWVRARHEGEVLQALQHADPHFHHNCVTLRSCFDFRKHHCLVFDLLAVSMYDFMKGNHFQPLPATHLWSVAKQLLEAVAFLHQQGIAHSDLKPENILLENTQDISWRSTSPDTMIRVLRHTEIQVTDFGSAVFSDEFHTEPMSTVYYRAPEILLDLGRSCAADLWSIGCILLELHTGAPVFDPASDLDHMAQIEAVLGRIRDEDMAAYVRDTHPEWYNAEGHLIISSYRPQLPDLIARPEEYGSYEYALLQLVSCLLRWDPARRISAQDALQLPFFSLSPDKFPVY